MTITAQVPDLELAASGITAQVLDLAATATVDPAALGQPGIPVPDDKTAVPMFVAHRLDDTLGGLAHATERMKAARGAAGELRGYHCAHLTRHLDQALDHLHMLTACIKEHYPAEATELEQLRQHVGLAAQATAVDLAKSLSPQAKVATTAHLLETTLHETTHAVRHAEQMTGPGGPDDLWAFNADHCGKHLAGAVQHAKKLAQQFTDNYPQVARWLTELETLSSTSPDEGGQHARYSGTRQMAATISGQIDLRNWEGWRTEPRDDHGRWTDGGVGLLEKVAEPIRSGGGKPVDALLRGTRNAYKPGDLIYPHPNADADLGSPAATRYTNLPAYARGMAEYAAGDKGKSHVYVVEPTGPSAIDPGSPVMTPGHQSWITEHPLRVVREYHENVTEPIRGEGARGNSRPVSEAEFQQLAAEGRDRLHDIQHQPWTTEGIRKNWDAIKARTYAEVQNSWGGATIDPRSGRDLPQGADKYAMSVKPTGLDTTSIPEHASRPEFDEAMNIALAKYGKQLAKGGSYLGVFHDDDLNRIDIDPVTVLDSLREVETIGAYTHAIGGAYHFASGDGFWPPHVPENAAAMSNPAGSGHHFAGPGQWHSQAVAVQQPHDEPEDTQPDEDTEPPADGIAAQATDLAWTRAQHVALIVTPAEQAGGISGQAAALAGGIGAQLELAGGGWRDAWRTELRGPHGEWVRAETEALNLHKLVRGAANPFVGAELPDTLTREQKTAIAARAGRYLNAAGPKVPAMISSGDHLDFDGKPPTLFNENDPGKAGLLADIDWNGHMSMSNEVAEDIQEALEHPDQPVRVPAALTVPLHEFIHATVPAGQKRSTNGDKAAYQDPTMAYPNIEEAFTELGAIQHAARFFDANGLGNRKISVPGSPPGATMDDLAGIASQPGHIRDGTAWGRYKDITAQAYEWVSLIAQQNTGKPESDPATQREIQRLSDEVNAVGTAAKPQVMAQHAVSDMLLGMPSDQTVLDSAKKSILDNWGGQDPLSMPETLSQARAAAQQRIQELQAERGAA